MGMLNPVPICPFMISTVLLSSNITYHWLFNMSNTTGVNSGAGTAYPEHLNLPPIPTFCGVRFAKSIDYPFDVILLKTALKIPKRVIRSYIKQSMQFPLKIPLD